MATQGYRTCLEAQLQFNFRTSSMLYCFMKCFSTDEEQDEINATTRSIIRIRSCTYTMNLTLSLLLTV